MPSQDAQGRWISDDGRSYWDGAAWRPLEAQATSATAPSPAPPAYGQAPSFEQMPPPFAPSYAAGYQPPYTQSRRSGVAIASLVLGILSLIFWLLPILGAPLAIAGIVTGVMGRSGTRRGMALAGLICSIIGLVLSLINGALGAYLAIQNQPHLFQGFLLSP